MESELAHSIIAKIVKIKDWSSCFSLFCHYRPMGAIRKGGGRILLVLPYAAGNIQLVGETLFSAGDTTGQKLFTVYCKKQ
jgi:hypothetical protein